MPENSKNDKDNLNDGITFLIDEPLQDPKDDKLDRQPFADFSSYFGELWESHIAIVVRPFTKSTNARGNDVYKGVGINATGHKTYFS